SPRHRLDFGPALSVRGSFIGRNSPPFPSTSRLTRIGAALSQARIRLSGSFYRRVEGVLICVCATTTRPDGQPQSSANVASPINAARVNRCPLDRLAKLV